jgi:hypothetical protein
MNNADIRKAVAERIAAAPDQLLERLRNANLPESADTLALAALALRLDGIRLRFVGWVARPEVEPEEEAGFLTVIDEAVTRAIMQVTNEQMEQRERTAGWLMARLNEWQRGREAWSTRPSRAAIEAMKDADPQTNEWEKIPLPDGTFAVRYNPRQDPQDVADEKRRARERAEKEARQ